MYRLRLSSCSVVGSQHLNALRQRGRQHYHGAFSQSPARIANDKQTLCGSVNQNINKQPRENSVEGNNQMRTLSTVPIEESVEGHCWYLLIREDNVWRLSEQYPLRHRGEPSRHSLLLNHLVEAHAPFL
jgi:hypothetical protein